MRRVALFGRLADDWACNWAWLPVLELPARHQRPVVKFKPSKVSGIKGLVEMLSNVIPEPASGFVAGRQMVIVGAAPVLG